MKAAVFKEKGVLKVEDVPDPEPGPRDVLIQVSHCAICGSDIHRCSNGLFLPGLIPGHEYAGEIVAKGKEVHEFETGDRVTRWDGKRTPSSYASCPARFKARELGFSPNMKMGAYAEYKAVDADRIMKIPDAITNLEAAMTEPLAVAVHTIRLSHIRLGDRALILGAGPMGLFVQQCASLAGASRIYVSEITAARRDMASELGASEVFDPAKINLIDKIVQHTEIGVDLAFECAGAHSTLQNALEAVRISGRVIVTALGWMPVHCLPVDWVGREVEMQTVYGTVPGDWLLAVQLIESGKIRVKPMISEIIALKDIQQTFQQLLKPDNPWVQVVVGFE